MFRKSVHFVRLSLLLTYTVVTKIGIYPELDPWNIIHTLGFITRSFLPIFVMIIAALAIFQAWIWVGVGIGSFLNGLCVRNIFNIKLHSLGACYCLAGCPSISLYYCRGLNAVME